jgi:hypothetical protein
MNPKLRSIIFKTFAVAFLLFISCSSSNTKSSLEENPCNENLAFKKVYFENIQNIENLETKSQNESFHNSLKFISKYAKVNFESMANYARTYPYGIFEEDKAGWLKWYEENRCNNIQFKD